MTTTQGREALAPEAFPWILRQRITIPSRVAGYIHRPALVKTAMPTGRRLTVLKASGGFGKTVLLAECCRELRQNGVATAYLSLDERDTPDMLDTYIAVACASAGLDMRHGPDSADLIGQPAYRTALAASRIQALGRPFVIAMDEFEQLKEPACAAIVEFMLQRGPSNLHLALSGRQLPDGLNVAALVMDGRAKMLDAEDLRFGRGDVDRFFNHRLSRRALARETQQSAGWPFALRILRNGIAADTGVPSGNSQVAGNWIESRLLARLGTDERDFILDLGLFGWLDETLLSEVLQLSDAMQHVRSLSVLDGLLEPVEVGSAPNWRLHPLIRRHCATRRFREDGDRFRRVHGRIAKALARRGETLAGMRHAIDGGDPFLAGEIFEQAGGVRLWVREGIARYQAAHELLTDEVVAQSPRLQLARCIALTLAGHQHRARALYTQCQSAEQRMDGFQEAAPGDRLADDCIVRGAMLLYGGEQVGSKRMRALLHDSARFSQSPLLDAPTRAIMQYFPSLLHFLKGEFEAALDRLSAVRTLYPESRYLAFYGELLHGQTCLMGGQAEAARSCFESARRLVREHLPLDPVAELSSQVTRGELVLECDPAAVVEPVGIRRALTARGTPFSFFTTALNLFTQIRLLTGEANQLADATRTMLVRVGSAGMPAFARLLAASRVSALVIAGHLDEAERTWLEQALPGTTASCLDMKTQSWREVEGVCEARGRLLTATGRYDEARDLLREFHAIAERHSFRRMQLRALALAIALELRAGQPKAGLRHLTRYLELFDESPYILPLVHERATCTDLLSQVAADASSPHKEPAEGILAAMRRVGERQGLSLTDRERQVLRRLPDGSVKAMAAALGLSVHGVRYHLRRLFAKFGVADRTNLLRRAKTLGLITDDA